MRSGCTCTYQHLRVVVFSVEGSCCMAFKGHLHAKERTFRKEGSKVGASTAGMARNQNTALHVAAFISIRTPCMALHVFASQTALQLGAHHPAGCFLFRYPIV